MVSGQALGKRGKARNSELMQTVSSYRARSILSKQLFRPPGEALNLGRVVGYADQRCSQQLTPRSSVGHGCYTEFPGVLAFTSQHAAPYTD